MPKEYFAIKKEDLKKKIKAKITISGKDIVLFYINDKYYALDDCCTHADAELSSGAIIQDSQIECPLHGACFDIKSGEVTQGPAFTPVKTYILNEKDDNIYILID